MPYIKICLKMFRHLLFNLEKLFKNIFSSWNPWKYGTFLMFLNSILDAVNNVNAVLEHGEYL